MTRINRKIVRVTEATQFSRGQERNIILSLSPGGDGGPGPKFIGLRLQGERTTYYLPADWCWREAMKGAVASAKLARALERKGRRHGQACA